jgi:hypothetical protein
VEQDGDGYGLIWGGGEPEYFFNEDWTGQITLSAFKKLVFARRAFRRKFFVPKGRSIHVSSLSGKSTARQAARMQGRLGNAWNKTGAT